MNHSIERRTFLVEKYHQLKNITLVKRAWRTEFKNNPAPSYTTIQNTIEKFETTGSVQDKPRKKRAQSENRQNAKTRVEEFFEENPLLSIRKASSAAQVSYTTIRSILLDDLHLKPYKIQEYHQLQLGDYNKRENFADWFLALPSDAKFFFIVSDEAYFYLVEPINKQNNRVWLKSRPTDGIERPLQDQKVLVWCAFSASKIYGPYFFEESVNQHNYLEMLQNFFWPLHQRVPHPQKYYFQQDGATPHTARVVQDWLSEKFEDRFIDKSMWPPRSPDINPCDFYLWGYLKSVVYNPIPNNLDELKENITREIKKISVETLRNVFFNLEKRCQALSLSKGKHIDNK